MLVLYEAYHWSTFPTKLIRLPAGRGKEFFDIIFKALTGEQFDYDGKSYNLTKVSIWPMPIQNPMPFRMRTGSQETIEFSAERRIVGCQVWFPTQMFKDYFDTYRSVAQERFGCDPAYSAFTAGRFVHVAETTEQAIEEAKPALEYMFGSQFTRESIDVGGITIYYLKGVRVELLLYLHGLGGWGAWERHIFGQAITYCPFVLQLPGWRDGRIPGRVSSVKDYAQLMLEFLDAADIPICVVVGHSIGGWIAQYFAADQPHRVSKLILLDSMGVDVLEQPAANLLLSQPNCWQDRDGEA